MPLSTTMPHRTTRPCPTEPHRTTEPRPANQPHRITQPRTIQTGPANQPRTNRRRTTGRIAATITALLAILLTTLAIPAQAAASSNTGTNQTHHPVASRRADHGDGLTVGALSLAGIVATAAGVLWYTARTRRTIDSDAS